MYLIAKRVFDIVVATLGLVALAPVLVAVAVAIRLNMRESALFRQVRPGYRERPFTLLKFRTMRTATDAQGNDLPDSKRMTRLGGLLRSTSVDECPQLWNVIKGEMSLVGPRPLLSQYLERYDNSQRRRHEVKPGITGWAQVKGRNTRTWEQKFDLDVWYVDHCNLWLDCKILWITIAKVLMREGISQDGHATMPEFQGTERS